jgi:DNA-binding LytR/AlgR family response regulator
MNVVIIEDEEFATRRLERMIGEIDPEIQIVAKLESVVESIKWLQEGLPVDLIFMDIHLEDNSSFTIFYSVSINCPVVFTTATDEKSTAIFRQNHLDYLLKPICSEELRKILEKYNRFDHQNWRSIDSSIFTNIRNN